MNAKEAREKAELFLSVENKSLIDKINKLIYDNVKKGNFTFHFYENINEFSIKHFRSEGFSIEHKNEGRNEFYYKISW